MQLFLKSPRCLSRENRSNNIDDEFNAQNRPDRRGAERAFTEYGLQPKLLLQLAGTRLPSVETDNNAEGPMVQLSVNYKKESEVLNVKLLQVRRPRFGCDTSELVAYSLETNCFDNNRYSLGKKRR